MKNLLNPALVKQALVSHSWIGLFTGVLMYLVCLSGTLAVFAPYLIRWEQPNAPSYESIAPDVLDRSYQTLLADNPNLSGDILLMLPRDMEPYASLVSEAGAWYLNEDGSRGPTVSNPWTDMLINLHLYLHLPSSFGMVVVSILGALLCAMIISGFLAHPRIFRDAFSLRLKGSRHLEQADIHNRLSVWGAPFHLVIAVTGAYFGLAALMSLLFASVLFNGDEEAVIGEIFGPAPVLEQQVEVFDIAAVLDNVRTVAPTAEPFYLTIEDANSSEQYMILGGRHRDRLIYAEQYRFDQDGEYINKAGYTDGTLGRQAIFSVFRLHFGHFGGPPMLVLYGIFGLALSVVSVTGVNIWLARRKQRDAVNNLWTGMVWGTPLALAVSAVVQLLAGTFVTLSLWATLVFAMALCQWLNQDKQARRNLQGLSSVALGLLVALHVFVHGEAALRSAALGVNLVLLTAALLLGWMALRQHRTLASHTITAITSPRTTERRSARQ